MHAPSQTLVIPHRAPSPVRNLLFLDLGPYDRIMLVKKPSECSDYAQGNETSSRWKKPVDDLML